MKVLFCTRFIFEKVESLKKTPAQNTSCGKESENMSFVILQKPGDKSNFEIHNTC
jgi:hypothetical protein